MRLDRATIRARVVLPVDGPPLDGGSVIIEDGRIAAIERGPCRTPHTDLGDVALLPGFVNAHTHLDFSTLIAPLGRSGMPLSAWLGDVIRYRQTVESTIGDAVRHGLREALRAGTTSLGEIASYEPAACTSLPLERTAFLEVIAPQHDQHDAALRDITRRLDQLSAVAGICAGISPHAPYTVPLPLLESLCDVARRRKLPLATHLAESREELELLATGHGPLRELLVERNAWDESRALTASRPLDYLNTLRSAPRALVIHGNYLSPSELELLAKASATMSLVYCPRTHAYFRHEPYPLAESLKMGICVALGTDGRGSNPDLSLLAEARYVHAHHADVAPETILEMATLSGARALGIESACGSITPGKKAHLVAVAIGSGPANDAARRVLSGEGVVQGVWHAGRLIDPAEPG